MQFTNALSAQSQESLTFLNRQQINASLFWRHISKNLWQPPSKPSAELRDRERFPKAARPLGIMGTIGNVSELLNTCAMPETSVCGQV